MCSWNFLKSKDVETEQVPGRWFGLDEPGAIDMWLGQNKRVSTQYQVSADSIALSD